MTHRHAGHLYLRANRHRRKWKGTRCVPPDRVRPQFAERLATSGARLRPALFESKADGLKFEVRCYVPSPDGALSFYSGRRCRLLPWPGYLNQRNARARLIKERLAKERKAPERCPRGRTGTCPRSATEPDSRLRHYPPAFGSRFRTAGKCSCKAEFDLRAGNFLAISALSGVLLGSCRLRAKSASKWLGRGPDRHVLPYAYASYRRNQPL